MPLLSETSLNLDAGTVVGLLVVASGIPSALIAWLHLRLNAVHAEVKEEMKDLDKEIKETNSDIVRKRDEVFSHLNNNFVRKDSLDSKIDLLGTEIKGLTTQIGNFVSLMRDQNKRQEEQSREINKIKLDIAEIKAKKGLVSD